MWTALTILFCLGLVFVHFWWKRRYEGGRAELREQKKQNAALQEQQQHALAQAQAEQQASFNSMVEGVLLLDDHERVRLVNQALEQLFVRKARCSGLNWNCPASTTAVCR